MRKKKKRRRHKSSCSRRCPPPIPFHLSTRGSVARSSPPILNSLQNTHVPLSSSPPSSHPSKEKNQEKRERKERRKKRPLSLSLFNLHPNDLNCFLLLLLQSLAQKSFKREQGNTKRALEIFFTLKEDEPLVKSPQQM